MNTLKISKDQFTRSPNQSAPGRRYMPHVGWLAIVPSSGIMSRSSAPTSESWPYRQPSGAGRLNNIEGPNLPFLMTTILVIRYHEHGEGYAPHRETVAGAPHRGGALLYRYRD